MMLQIGTSDPSLRREIGSIKNPTLLNFNDKIVGYEQARKTESSTAFGLATKGSMQKRQGAQSTRNTQKVNQNRAEKALREAGEPHCEAGASDAQGRITCCLNALTRHL